MDTPDALHESDRHAFVGRPHRTFFALSLPVLLSLVVEPLTGVVDTAFVSRLGAAPLAGLGAATTLLSSVFWIFNFLGIGTQTEVAGAAGSGGGRGREASSPALGLSLVIGIGIAVPAWILADALTSLMSPDAPVRAALVQYFEIRLLSAPAVLLMLASFGALRGLQDMRTPLWIAAAANLVNALLDPLLIFGWGPLPALGMAGAAWASTAGLWLGALWGVASIRRRLGLSPRIPWRDAPALLRVGRDLFLRTGLLSLFLLLATRAATQLGPAEGAAHQVVRQVWILTAFVLDAYAATAQSLVAYFLGAGRAARARHAATVACLWGVGSGLLLTAGMVLGEAAVARGLVPPAARAVFGGAWLVLALAQPLNALSFVTDGIHWGTRDYRYLRNAMFAATACGTALLFLVPGTGPTALARIWWVTAAWISVRAVFGVLRIWPGLGAAPLRAHLRAH